MYPSSSCSFSSRSSVYDAMEQQFAARIYSQTIYVRMCQYNIHTKLSILMPHNAGCRPFVYIWQLFIDLPLQLKPLNDIYYYRIECGVLRAVGGKQISSLKKGKYWKIERKNWTSLSRSRPSRHEHDSCQNLLIRFPFSSDFVCRIIQTYQSGRLGILTIKINK